MCVCVGWVGVCVGCASGCWVWVLGVGVCVGWVCCVDGCVCWVGVCCVDGCVSAGVCGVGCASACV